MSTPHPPLLAAIQARMQAHVLSGDAMPGDVVPGDSAALADLAQGPGLSAERRLGIYRHAYRVRLTDVLRDSYGHTLLYLGDDWFDHLAAAFIGQHPSAHANLRWYGQAWPDWLAQELVAGTQAGAHPEVAELARLDWALRQAFDAADAPPLTLADLAAMPAPAWATVVLKPQPSVALLAMRHNTLGLWQALDQGMPVPAPVLLDEPVAVLVWRRGEQPHFRGVAPMEAQALGGLLQGLAFAEICASLADRFPHEDAAAVMGQLLRRWVDDTVLTRC